MKGRIKEILHGLFIASLLLTLIVVVPIKLWLFMGDMTTRRLKKHGDEIVAQIETYKSKNGKLPLSLTALGLKDFPDELILYEKKSESNYIIYFGTSLGESTIYSSEKRKWDDENK